MSRVSVEKDVLSVPSLPSPGSPVSPVESTEKISLLKRSSSSLKKMYVLLSRALADDRIRGLR